jgi:radical SAM superfamily enzyme YgiQ (UPF0313 family)
MSDELTISEPEWAHVFCSLKRERKMNFLFRINSARVDMVNKRILQELYDEGMVAITFGIESGSQLMLDKMRKGVKTLQNLEALRLCSEVGLQSTIALVVGLPGENFRTVFETTGFLMKCPSSLSIGFDSKRYLYDDMFDIRIFSPVAFPKTPLYNELLRTGPIKDEHKYMLSLNDNDQMRAYNFTGFPSFLLVFWSHWLYFVYRACYCWRQRKYPKIFYLMITNLIMPFLPRWIVSRLRAIKRFFLRQETT